MKTLIVGAGATGGYFGGRLAQAGRDVTFLVRPPRSVTLNARGLGIRTMSGEVERVAVRAVTADQLDEPFDLIVLAVKAFGLDSAMQDFDKAVGPDTVIVPFLNGMVHVTRLVETFGESRVFGGVCMVATTLDSGGDVVQLSETQRLRYGPLSTTDDARSARVHEALSGAAFASEVSVTIVQDMWEKWVLLSTLGAITCLMRGNLAQVNSVEGGARFAAAVAEEAISVASAAGYPPRLDAATALRRAVIASDAPTTSSMFRDLVQGLRTESDAIVGDLVRRARHLDVAVPLLETVWTNLNVYEWIRVDELARAHPSALSRA